MERSQRSGKEKLGKFKAIIVLFLGVCLFLLSSKPSTTCKEKSKLLNSHCLFQKKLLSGKRGCALNLFPGILQRPPFVISAYWAEANKLLNNIRISGMEVFLFFRTFHLTFFR